MINFVVQHLSPALPPLPARPLSAPRRVGYYLWRFPMLSETFIQREIEALRRAGLALHVFAEAPADVELLDVEARAQIAATTYLLPADPQRLSRYQRRYFFRRPLRYLQLLRYTMAQRYGAQKNLEADLRIFHSAVTLAGCSEDAQIDHLHSPWANASAFVVLLASRFAGIPYSVEARASADLYRQSTRHALAEKFGHASFVVTNAQFNAAFIRLCMDERARVPVHVVYEGLDLARVRARCARQTPPRPVRILSVARLVEEKGLVYLLRALTLLRERGCTFSCEIVGAPDAEGDPRCYAELQAEWRALQLTESVAFVGPLPFEQVLARYESADIFVLPCVPAQSGARDVTPNALIEAMAMGLAVISTNMSGIPEIVEHGVSGLLVPPRNTRGVAQALAELSADPDLRQRLGHAARARVEQRFDSDKNVLTLLSLFRGQPSTHPTPAASPARAATQHTLAGQEPDAEPLRAPR